jgi:hypothetical protein
LPVPIKTEGIAQKIKGGYDLDTSLCGAKII